jgi:hypothetical protein
VQLLVFFIFGLRARGNRDKFAIAAVQMMKMPPTLFQWQNSISISLSEEHFNVHGTSQL